MGMLIVIGYILMALTLAVTRVAPLLGWLPTGVNCCF